MRILRPCSACGNTEPTIKDCGYTTFNPYWVECSECDYKTESSYGRDSAIANWNKVWEDGQFLKELGNLRSREEGQVAEIAQLRELLQHIVSQLNEGYGAARIRCALPPHLETLYDEFLTTDAAG